MKILLIGATGQIGFALTQALAKTEHHLSILVRNKRKLPFPDNINIIETADFNAHAFKTALAGAEHVIYGVGLPEQFLFDDTVFEQINYGLLKIFLEEFRKTGLKSLTYISTYEVFQDADGVIRETHPTADESQMTPYFQAMTRAYKLVSEFASTTDIEITTIHPAAVYGGLNTGHGFTNYIENLRHKRFWQVPFIIKGRFPLVHADSLAEAIIKSLGQPGSYIVSDQMTSLREIALALKNYTNSYAPLTAPVWLAKLGTFFLEALARLTHQIPMMARVQIEFITKGIEPEAGQAISNLNWQPLPLSEGLRRYLNRQGG
ncbi:NAD-dependent epimerase/dehydratase family protein [Chloroflexota bacterium]